ncbi:hypothetical protein CSC73_14480 [Pseudoxanthomonas sacheonensis]|nr:hypothetical protein CSC73_14480 [Pseudoxanthomonas sacheonensis]
MPRYFKIITQWRQTQVIRKPHGAVVVIALQTYTLDTVIHPIFCCRLPGNLFTLAVVCYHRPIGTLVTDDRLYIRTENPRVSQIDFSAKIGIVRLQILPNLLVSPVHAGLTQEFRMLARTYPARLR